VSGSKYDHYDEYVILQIKNWMKNSQKHVGLAQQNGFSSGMHAVVCSLLRL
jgi:hypothetical protein